MNLNFATLGLLLFTAGAAGSQVADDSRVPEEERQRFQEALYNRTATGNMEDRVLELERTVGFLMLQLESNNDRSLEGDFLLLAMMQTNAKECLANDMLRRGVDLSAAVDSGQFQKEFDNLMYRSVVEERTKVMQEFNATTMPGHKSAMKAWKVFDSFTSPVDVKRNGWAEIFSKGIPGSDTPEDGQ